MNGLLLINKPAGMTSHDVVSRVRYLLKTKEVGHSGTLDPMATGLMVLLIGEATKLSSYVTEGDKSYAVGIRPGVTTDTLDITGQILAEKQVQCSEGQIQELALSLVGEFQLPIPMFSAKKVDGKKLYEYAREGVQIEQPQKKMAFWNVTHQEPLKFHLHCSKGSFIRSWVQLLGDRMGCGAAMASLERTSSHQYNLTEAMTLAELASMEAQEVSRKLVPLDKALKGVKSIRVKGQDAVLMKNGQISHSLRSQLISRFNPDQDEIIQILPEEKGRLLALVGLEKQQGFKIKRVFNC
ncbi:tRNA pseudouridine(55) synthase TruB [Pseudobdellovibrio exovorus]|uniref:tRNA pseudouridine synthase B n=1 Tax=Pseudobdellovibrio exovorus JSS TaxID=1184267 RepID=M4VCK2_9BACT|nr:tRNA pseudouridine(55) synthase TruB [Pseudobdellovibrio exovorus]AGH95766.1 tRNA pseudouridine synthase B [Pseudobdellovibrio exovorus JSS]